MSDYNKDKYKDVPFKDVLKEFSVDPEKGLSSSDVNTRLQKYGINSLQAKETPFWKRFLASCWGPISWMIIAAAALSAFLKDWMDFSIIVLMMFINATLRFFQEYKAGNAIASLKKNLAPRSKVLRDGKWGEIEAKDLVPGDIISVKIGNIIPADIKLFSGDYLTVDQSSLTGESLPVSKKIDDRAFSGTIVKTGEMLGIVTETGMNTSFGKTAKLIDIASVQSHFQKAILKVGNFLIFATIAIVAIIAIISLYRIKVHALDESLASLAIFTLVLIVAGIPIALPAVLSATMAIGASRLAELKAIVTKLTTIERLSLN